EDYSGFRIRKIEVGGAANRLDFYDPNPKMQSVRTHGTIEAITGPKHLTYDATVFFNEEGVDRVQVENISK
ncbi:MAG: hypothetical protein AAF570_05425, partial [Bacteroidota bacterium]